MGIESQVASAALLRIFFVAKAAPTFADDAPARFTRCGASLTLILVVGETIVKAFLSACLACLVISFAAYKALDTQQMDSSDRYATSGVRLDDAARSH